VSMSTSDHSAALRARGSPRLCPLRALRTRRLRRAASRFAPPLLAHLSVLSACVLTGLGMLFSASQASPPSHYEIREVRSNVFVWVPEDILDMDTDPQFNRAAAAGFIITSEGVVVVNTTNSPFHARELLYEIRRRTDQPVRYVIDTDSHPDQMLGNEVFQDLRATIVSTTEAAAEMRAYQRALGQRLAGDYRLPSRMRGIHPTLPTRTFDRDWSIQLGGQQIKVLKLANGHSAGDAVVYLPDSKVLFLGHLFENAYFPRLASGDVHRWIEILRQVETWNVDTYIPAHGLPGDRLEVKKFRQFLEWLSGEVEARIREGQSLEQVKRELNPLEKYDWAARDLAVRAIEDVYRQLEATRSPTGDKSVPATPGTLATRALPPR
jgi:cyclase